MARSRSSAKQAGSRMERVAADYLAAHVDDRIDRRVKTGAADKGDLGGIRFLERDERGQAAMTGRVTAEVKDCAKVQLGTWLNEAEAERINDGADVGLVIFKAHGKGDPGDQRVVMTLRDLATLLSGVRPDA
jgi:hypothetical protein